MGIALKAMKNGKTPGIDGFPGEFFKLKFFLLRGMNHAYEYGAMLYLQSNQVLSVGGTSVAVLIYFMT